MSDSAARVFDISSSSRYQVDMAVENGLPSVFALVDSNVEARDRFV
jgi:hypothetical protein